MDFIGAKRPRGVMLALTVVPGTMGPWFDHLKNSDLYKFGKFNINKHLTNAKLHKFQQIDQRKKSKSA